MYSDATTSALRRIGACYFGIGTAAVVKAVSSEGSCDLESGHDRWRAIVHASRARALPSAYTPLPVEALRFQQAGSSASGILGSIHPFSLDPQTRAWVTSQLEAPRGVLHRLAVGALAAAGIGQCDAEALLDAPAVHLLSHSQWAELLAPLLPDRACADAAVPRLSAVDVGAGSGHITGCWAPLFDEVAAVEVSDCLAWRLRRRGFAAAVHEEASAAALLGAGLPGSFTAVFALNVLDRVDDASKFLANLAGMVKPGGVLVVALPLPFCSRSWKAPSASAAIDVAQSECKGALPIRGDTWEHAAADLVHCLGEHGLEVVKVARAPYLCQGWVRPLGEQLYCLDAAVLVARVVDHSGRLPTGDA